MALQYQARLIGQRVLGWLLDLIRLIAWERIIHFAVACDVLSIQNFRALAALDQFL